MKPHRTRPTREETQARTRERLVESAAEVFARNGYERASVDLIAESVGYSKGAFYSNFDSKEAIFLLLLERHKDREIQALRAFLNESEEVEGMFSRLEAFYGELETDADWGLLTAEFQLQASREPEFARRIAPFYRDQVEALGKLIADLFVKTRRKLPAPSDELATIFMAMAAGIALQRAAGIASKRRGMLGDAIALVLRSLLGGARGG